MSKNNIAQVICANNKTGQYNFYLSYTTNESELYYFQGPLYSSTYVAILICCVIRTTMLY